MTEVDVPALSPGRFRALMSEERFADFQREAVRAAERLRGVTVWNVNSTAKGGGVAEMLSRLLGYVRGGGTDARWLVLGGDDRFFLVTKRIHNRLHGAPGDGAPLDDAARTVYEEIAAASAADLGGRVRPGDVVVLHDPQTAGLIPAVRRLGALVVWRCHVGTDQPGELADEAWSFLLPYVTQAHAVVFSRAAFVWRGLDASRVTIIPPSIDAFAPKNRDLDAATVRSTLSAAGIVPDGTSDPAKAVVRTGASMIEDVPVPAAAPLVVQVSRWDRLKDPEGVMEAFATRVVPASGAHLVLAGPSAESVADDPEGVQVLDHCAAVRAALPAGVRERVHLACLPMRDADENALMVNALQRRADVVVQKSLAEGFGLTVAEAMWKARPIVASGVGGIRDQIEHGRTGLLVDDPRDLAQAGDEIRTLLEQRERATAMALAAQEAVRERFLPLRHLLQYAALLESLAGPGREQARGAAS